MPVLVLQVNNWSMRSVCTALLLCRQAVHLFLQDSTINDRENFENKCKKNLFDETSFL